MAIVCQVRCDVCNRFISHEEDEEASPRISIQVGREKHESVLCSRCEQTVSVFAAREALRTGLMPKETWRRITDPVKPPAKAKRPSRRPTKKAKPKRRK